VAFQEALSPDFKEYQRQVVTNAKALAESVASKGFRIVSGGTDNHLFMADVFSKGITGRDAEKMLESAGVTVNKNTIPFDQNKPMVASGVRMGTPAITTRGLREGEMPIVADLIARVLDSNGDSTVVEKVAGEVRELCRAFPVY
jgi:glycine hydroxymethyltransferase